MSSATTAMLSTADTPKRIKGKRRRSLDSFITIECLLSGMFLVSSLFFLTVAMMDPEASKGGAVVSVDRLVLQQGASSGDDPEAVTVDEVITVLTEFLKTLHKRLRGQKEGMTNYENIYQIYHDVTVDKLYPWDLKYLKHMPRRRDDDSIFLSIASYRDENCFNTLTYAYQEAAHPDRLNVGLVQQNCVRNCVSGILDKTFRVDAVEPDPDCHALFCDSALGKPHCDAGRVRALHVEEDESLGPYVARYFASKLWNGESWFMQIDSHSTFAPKWDADSVQMLQNAPSDKPIISHYPPSTTKLDFAVEAKEAAPRICGGVFAGSEIESQIIRLEDVENYDTVRMDVPRFAPFVAAGYFCAHSSFLKEVPFDPFLPWIFMGEEIIMSARFWTHGYDIFSPTHSVLGHMYVRKHKPKFWESVGRLFWPGVNNLIQDLVLNRVKCQLGYPESARDVVWPPSIYTGLEHYSMGKVRSVKDYMKMVGLDPERKELLEHRWCETGQPPEFNKEFAHLYPNRPN